MTLRAPTLFLTIVLLASPALAQGEVNIYSYREPGLIDPLLKAFTEKTGIKVNVVFASAGLNERLAAEGANSPADILLTVDAGRLSEAKNAGLTQAVKSPALEVVPPAYRDPDGHWYGLTMRARVVYASKDRVKQDSITYEELADPKWKGKICIRSGQHVYNTSLLATIIAHEGEEAADQGISRDCGDFADHCASGYTFFRRDTQERATADQFDPAHQYVYVVYDATKPGTENTPTGTTYYTTTPGNGGQAAIFFTRFDGASGTHTTPTPIDSQTAGHQVFPDVSADNPADPDDVLIGVSSGGAWRTRDGGQTWNPSYGMRNEYMPPGQRARLAEFFGWLGVSSS